MDIGFNILDLTSISYTTALGTKSDYNIMLDIVSSSEFTGSLVNRFTKDASDPAACDISFDCQPHFYWCPLRNVCLRTGIYQMRALAVCIKRLSVEKSP